MFAVRAILVTTAFVRNILPHFLQPLPPMDTTTLRERFGGEDGMLRG